MILRFILLVSLAIWFGGFTFYSTAVIYTAQEVLHSHLRAGLITQQVTRWLNLVSLPPLLLCLFHQYRLRFAWREWFVKILGMALLIMILTQAGLFLMHPVIDAQVVDREVPDGVRFFQLHRLYEGIATLQWCATLVYFIAMLKIWSRIDSSHPASAR